MRNPPRQVKRPVGVPNCFGNDKISLADLKLSPRFNSNVQCRRVNRFKLFIAPIRNLENIFAHALP